MVQRPSSPLIVLHTKPASFMFMTLFSNLASFPLFSAVLARHTLHKLHLHISASLAHSLHQRTQYQNALLNHPPGAGHHLQLRHRTPSPSRPHHRSDKHRSQHRCRGYLRRACGIHIYHRTVSLDIRHGKSVLIRQRIQRKLKLQYALKLSSLV